MMTPSDSVVELSGGGLKGERTIMSLFQRFIAAILPRRWVEAMEAESRVWIRSECLSCDRCQGD